MDFEKQHKINVLIFQQRVNKIYDEAIRIAAQMGIKADTDTDFQWKDYPQFKSRVDEMLKTLKKQLEVNIVNGIHQEWSLANKKGDELATKKLGEKSKLTEDEQKLYFGHNDEARDAFIGRKENGLNLSERVWKLAEQFKKDTELGISSVMQDGLQNGKSAEELQRKVKQYLNEPNKIFRRRRNKETGELELSKPAKNYHPGTGVYRSSRKNALRLTGTEINMAYRNADYERVKNFDFVLGIKVITSNNHPTKDICDKLAGVYPKGFRFIGWHPNCRCHTETLLKTDKQMAEERKARREALLNDEPMPKKTNEGEITDLPKNFVNWRNENSDAIEAAKKRGKLPWFLKENMWALEEDEAPAVTPIVIDEAAIREQIRQRLLDAAKARHAKRTAEEKQEIIDKWEKRKQAIRYAEELLTDFEDMKDVDTTALKEALEHGRWDDVRKEALELAKKKRSIIEDAITLTKELDGIKDIETAELKKALKEGNVSSMKAQNDMLKEEVAELKALKNIDNPIEVAREFSKAQAEVVDKKIQDFFNRFTWDFNSRANLQKLKSALEYEIKWMGTKGTKYETWLVSQNAYKKRLALVEKRIEMLDVKEGISSEIDLIEHSKSTVGKALIDEFNKLFDDDTTDIKVLEKAAEAIKKKADSLEAKKRRRDKKKINIDGFVPKSDAETRSDFVKYFSSIGASVSESEVVVDNGFVHLQKRQHRSIYENNNIETATEHEQLWNHTAKTITRWGRAGYIQTGNSFKINGDFRATKVVGAIDATAEAKLRAHGMTDDDLETVRLLDKKIKNFSLPVPLIVTRYVDISALDIIFGQKFKSSSIKGLITEVNAIKSGKDLVPDPAYTSASTNELQNVFYSQYDVKLMIEVPPKTPMYFSDNYQESEIVLSRLTKLRYISATIGNTGGYTHLIIRCRLVQ